MAGVACPEQVMEEMVEAALLVEDARGRHFQPEADALQTLKRRRCGAIGLCAASAGAMIALTSWRWPQWVHRVAPGEVQLLAEEGGEDTEAVASRTDAADAADLNASACGGEWDQCGGDGFAGAECCEEGFSCEKKPLKKLPSYRQCRPVEKQCEDMEGREDKPCFYKVQWDMTIGIKTSPNMYHGLTADSSFKEFQEQNWMLLREKSKCPPPCAPGTCYQVLRYEGCDQHKEWNCEKDDGTLGYDCCCNKYHHNLTVPAAPPTLRTKKGAKKRDSMFCVALAMPDSYEVELLREQLAKGGLGMFGCDAWAVVSNESFSLYPDSTDPGYNTVVMDGDLEAAKGGKFNTTLNTPIFIRFWDQVLSDGRALDYDWVVKLDPDTMFMPDRLLELLRSKKGALGKPDPEGGMYLNNCFLGLHGPIEVMSRNALQNYQENKEKCTDGSPAEHGQEDWFMRACFEELDVLKVDTFNLLLEGEWACKERPSAWKPDYRPPCFSPQVAFHPYKDIKSYMHCWAEAVSHHVANPLDPISDKPVPGNERHG